MKLSKWVILNKDQDELSNIYNLADVFCTSSLDDNFPSTVIEAMACGIPVVGFKVGGISEQVTENCGILVKLKDTKNLGKAIEKLLKEETIRKSFSLNCRERVLQIVSRRWLERFVRYRLLFSPISTSPVYFFHFCIYLMLCSIVIHCSFTPKKSIIVNDAEPTF